MVTVALVGERPGRPPKVDLLFDVTLCNPADSPRWFVLPSLLTVSWARPAGGVHTLEEFEVTGRGRAVLGKFLGNGGFQAVCVPPGGRLALHELPILFWEEIDPNGVIAVDVIVARGIKVGGQAVESWFSQDPTSDKNAEVAKTKMIAARQNPDLKEIQLELDEEARASFQIRRGHA